MVKVLGLPVEAVDENDQVISVLLVIKSFSPDSETGVAYQVCATDGLTTVEALGMAHLAVAKVSHGMGEP